MFLIFYRVEYRTRERLALQSEHVAHLNSRR